MEVVVFRDGTATTVAVHKVMNLVALPSVGSYVAQEPFDGTYHGGLCKVLDLFISDKKVMARVSPPVANEAHLHDLLERGWAKGTGY